MDSFFKNLSNNDLSDYENPDLIRAFDDYFRNDFIQKGFGLFDHSSNRNKSYNLFVLYSIFGNLPNNFGKLPKDGKFKDICLKESIYENFCKKFLIKEGWREEHEVPLFFHYYKTLLSGIVSFIFITNVNTYAMNEEEEGIRKIPTKNFFKNLRVGKSWFHNGMDYYSDDEFITKINLKISSDYKNNTPDFLEYISKNYNSYITFQENYDTWTKVE